MDDKAAVVERLKRGERAEPAVEWVDTRGWGFAAAPGAVQVSATLMLHLQLQATGASAPGPAASRYQQ